MHLACEGGKSLLEALFSTEGAQFFEFPLRLCAAATVG